ncbi:L-lysine dehydrogenase [Virgibacillus dakarensis]|uniref:Saccharopine dehydrogenase n=1 Tax=Lentibacillus populi TaxID=1827502 RepID=A0A9W5U0X2_9BACI|nr:saccharopine dehydrogenase C-terminal domain-containing protein [Lentibacillus populi]MBT2218538.1 saccharopine dehydrogenase NADP-binding domain-containing protein [Virgibacillus dakarensis]MTW86249.1 L-lysine dehydrogenase [Virgibacillus dakarensis]GGB52881.1 saccharopine dehydrogenase [Lentibacillus populi]
MHAVVLGTGMIGTTVVRELAKYQNIEKVTAVDGVKENVDKCLLVADNPKVNGHVTDLQTEKDIYNVLKDADIGIACLPHSLSLTAINAAIAAKCNLVDLVGSKYEEKIKLDNRAKQAEVIIVPGCGVAPGITNFLAAKGIEMLDEADEAVMICGGIPRHPLPPLWYQVVFRLESVMGLYTRPALAAENGKLISLPPLSGLELMNFPEPVGECEAVITDAHSAAYTLKDKVKKLYEKTVRYSGHWSKMAVLAELGYLDKEIIEVDGNPVSPARFTEKILEPKLRGKSNEDITVLRVVVKGKRDGMSTSYTWEMVDFYDHERNITSMAKTTAIPAMLVANWIVNGRIKEKGIIPVEKIMIGERFDPFISELNEYGIDLRFQEKHY